MNRKLLLLAVLSAIAVSACKPAQPPAEAAMPAATAEPVAPLAVESAPAATPADVPFDTKGFAGVFTGTLPCADCPGIDTRIALNRDGTYLIEETYQGKPERFSGDGTWTAEENGKRLRLDPNSKSLEDRLFAIASQDQIDQLDTAGNVIATTMPHSLKRTGPATQ